MNQKEISELRRRFQPQKTAITQIYGCYVNDNKEIVSYIDEPVAMLPEDEINLYLSLMKKSLSGKQGKNLIDIVFSTEQVMDSDEHKMLMGLRDCRLQDHDQREAFYRKVIDCLEMEVSSYLILLGFDVYDVPYQAKDGARLSDASDNVYRYIICAICPVVDGKQELGYFSGDNEFHNRAAAQVVSAPELGFLFPAFDDRTANIYNALFYARKPDELHYEFINGVFHVDAPMTPSEQRAAFRLALSEAEICGMNVIQGLHEQLKGAIDAHKEAKIPEPLTVSAKDIAAILTDCGAEQEKITAFEKSFGEQFGDGVVLSPENLIDSNKFEIKSGEATVGVEPEHSYMIESRMIDGRKYILVPVDVDTEINGFAVNV